MSDIPRMVSVPEAAQMFNLSTYAVRMLLKSGAVHGLRIGRGRLLVNADSLAQYLREAYVNDEHEGKQ